MLNQLNTMATAAATATVSAAAENHAGGRPTGQIARRRLRRIGQMQMATPRFPAPRYGSA